MKITLIRHGQPHIDLKAKVRPNEIGKWFSEYNIVKIKKESRPDKTTVAALSDCKFIVCSDFARSIHSAEILNVNEIGLIDPGFREVDIPYPDWNFPKAELRLFAGILRVLWFFGYSNNCNSIITEKARAKRAADKLVKYAQENQSVLFVGHGLFNHLLSKELRSRGWTGPKNPGRRYWEYGEYFKS